MDKKEFINCLNHELSVNRRFAQPLSILIHNPETMGFDVETAMAEWAKQSPINFAVIDIPKLSAADLDELPDILSKPTVFLYKNYGDYKPRSEAAMIRESYRKLLKDRCYPPYGGMLITPAPNFLFAVATVTNDTFANLDSSERGAFTTHLNLPD